MQQMKRFTGFVRLGALLVLAAVFSGCQPATEYASPTIGTLIYVPAGSFQRDYSAANVSVISRPFYMSRHQIIQAQFAAIMGTNPSFFTDGEDAGSRPVEQVSWYDAIAFANKLSIAEGLNPVYSVDGIDDWENLAYRDIPAWGNARWTNATADWEADGYRLPTEMEWMWAAMGATEDALQNFDDDGVNRSGHTKAFAGDDGTNSIDEYAWYSGTTDTRHQPVGSRKPNELGLYDMSGNVWEWNWDWYDDDHPSGVLIEYRGPDSGTDRVRRGGSWGFNASFCELSYTGHNSPHSRFSYNGFRLVRR